MDGRRRRRGGLRNERLDNHPIAILAPIFQPRLGGVRGRMRILVTLRRRPESPVNTIHCNFMGKPHLKAGSLAQLPWQQS